MQADSNIKVASCSVSELFSNELSASGIQGQLTIPEYQRPYIWGEKEISKLIDDVCEHFKTNPIEQPDYYLGSIILHQQNGNLNIIDGQQRITTLGIIFILLGQQVSIHYSSPVSIQVIRNNATTVREKLARLTPLKEFIAHHINVTLIVTQTEDDAYNFFETQNTGGIRLRGVDIIKAFHLRAIEKESERSRYAIDWESLSGVNEVVKMLLKARRWNILSWSGVPGRMDTDGEKKAIIKEFSGNTGDRRTQSRSFQLVEMQHQQHGITISLPEYPFHVRQPLTSGENFIDYLKCFCKLYCNTFTIKDSILANKELIKFYNDIIFYEDCTTFLKWLFEICILCYVHRFGSKNLHEASYWIFRVSYSMRLSHEKKVPENSIPKFVKEERILEYILQAFGHEECMNYLKQFELKIDENNITGNTAKARFIQRVSMYFEFENTHINFDNNLINGIYRKLKNAEV